MTIGTPVLDWSSVAYGTARRAALPTVPNATEKNSDLDMRVL